MFKFLAMILVTTLVAYGVAYAIVLITMGLLGCIVGLILVALALAFFIFITNKLKP